MWNLDELFNFLVFASKILLPVIVFIHLPYLVFEFAVKKYNKKLIAKEVLYTILFLILMFVMTIFALNKLGSLLQEMSTLLSII